MSQELQNQKVIFLTKLKVLLLDFHSLDSSWNSLVRQVGRQAVRLSVLASDPLKACTSEPIWQSLQAASIKFDFGSSTKILLLTHIFTINEQK